MKAYVEVLPGWYEVNIPSPEDEFKKRLDVECSQWSNIPIDENDLPYDCLIHVYTNVIDVYCVDTYYRSNRQDDECYGFGKHTKVYHQVEIHSIDWLALPAWVNWATVDADGALKFHNNKPVPFRYVWSADGGMAGRAKHKHITDYTIRIEIPAGVDWRQLIEERPNGVRYTT